MATGTLWSGRIGAGDELRADPAGLDVRVRSVEVHDRSVDIAEAGQRVAVSLPGIERTQLQRGDALVAPGAYPLSYRLDVALDELEPIGDGARIHVHHGTAETPAVVKRIGERYAQLRLAAPAVAARGDRVVLRAETTIGGGRVIDPAPPRHKSVERLELLEQRGRGRDGARAGASGDVAARAGRESLKDWSGPATGCSPTHGSWSTGQTSSGGSTPPILSTPASRRPQSHGPPT